MGEWKRKKHCLKCNTDKISTSSETRTWLLDRYLNIQHLIQEYVNTYILAKRLLYLLDPSGLPMAGFSLSRSTLDFLSQS